MTIKKNSEGIKIPGYKGTWYVIDHSYYSGRPCFLLESEVWGDEAAGIIVDIYGNVILDDVYNGFSDLDDLE